MNQELIVTSEGQLKEIEDSIFAAVLIDKFYVHLLKLDHFCMSEFSGLLKNNHPIIKVIRVCPSILSEFFALREVLKSRKGTLYLFCPSCGAATTEE